MSLVKGKCECPSHSELINETCVPDPGFYIETDPKSGFDTKPCDARCEDCFGKGSKNCGKCANNIEKVNGNCNFCLDGMFLYGRRCVNCSEMCGTCLNSSFCTSCKDKTRKIVDGVCVKTCPDRSYNKNDTCVECPRLCTKCSETCEKCVENSFLDLNSECYCNQGFTERNNDCEENIFTAHFRVLSNRFCRILFSENIYNLNSSDFNFSIGNRSDFEVNLLKIKKNSEYVFGFIFKNEVKEGTFIYVNITKKPLYSKKYSRLNDYEFIGILPQFIPVVIDPGVQAVLNSSVAAAQTMVSSSVGAALISNPSAAWALLNTIQILIYLPLNSNKMTENIKRFLSGFSGYNIIPNVMKFVFSHDSCSEPYLEARRFGINTCVFLLNMGPNFMTLISVLLIWPFIYCLSKCKKGKIAAKSLKLLGNYRYSFFLRYWTQIYLEAGIFAIIQIKSVNFIQSITIKSEGYTNNFFASLSIVLNI